VKRASHLARILAPATAMSLFLACAGGPNPSGKADSGAASAPSPAAKAGASMAAGQAVLPDHYSSITYPEFAYVPPHPSQYRVTLDKGVVAYLVPDTALALIQMAIYFGHPNVASKPEDVGALRLYSSLLKTGGTVRFTPEQLEDSLEFVAASLGASLSDYQSEMSLDALRKDAYALFDLLPETALQPRLDAEAFKVQKRTYVENIRHRFDTPRGVMAKAYEHVLHGPHPVNWSATEKEVEALTPARLKSLSGSGFSTKGMVIGVAGQFDRNTMIAQLNRLIAKLPDAYKSGPDSLPPFRGAAAPGVYLVDKQAAQATIKMGAPGVKRPHPDYDPLAVASYVFGDGGFTSRLMEKVRSNEGLAYGVDSDVGSDYNRQATVGVSLQTKVETGAYAVKIVLEEMEKMARQGITDAELQRAKDGLIKSLPSMFDTPIATARIFAQGEIWKRDPDHYVNYVKTLEKMTKEEVNAAFRKYFNKDSMRIVVVGPKETLLKKDARSGLSLSSLGPVKELSLADIETRK
jgi:zinc protease